MYFEFKMLIFMVKTKINYQIKPFNVLTIFKLMFSLSG